jgi:RNA polymerase primary sigma factor
MVVVVKEAPALSNAGQGELSLPKTADASPEYIRGLQKSYTELRDKMLECPLTVGALLSYLSANSLSQKDLNPLTHHNMGYMSRMIPEVARVWERYSVAVREQDPVQVSDVTKDTLRFLKELKLTNQAVNLLMSHFDRLDPQIAGAEHAQVQALKLGYRSLEVDTYALLQGLDTALERSAWRIARRSGGGISDADLISEGWLQLYKALHQFDPERGVPFGAYAIQWAKAGMYSCVYDSSRTVRVPRWVLKELKKIDEFVENKLQTNGKEPTEAELAEHFHNHSIQTRARSLYVREKSVSPQQALENEALPVEERAGAGQRPLEEVGVRELVEMNSHLMQQLSEHERQVITLRFGLDDGIMKTFAEIGKIINRTGSRAEQISSGAIKKLKALWAD